MGQAALLWLVLGLSTAQADPVWERKGLFGANVGLGLVVHLGPLEQDTRRLGLALDADAQWYWHEGKHGWDGPIPLAPLARVTLSVAWLNPRIGTTLGAEAGMLYPIRVYNRGYLPAVGLIGGGSVFFARGLALPTWTATAIGPLVEARLESSFHRVDILDATPWERRLIVGPTVPLNCCDAVTVDISETTPRTLTATGTAPGFTGTAPPEGTSTP